MSAPTLRYLLDDAIGWMDVLDQLSLDAADWLTPSGHLKGDDAADELRELLRIASEVLDAAGRIRRAQAALDEGQALYLVESINLRPPAPALAVLPAGEHLVMVGGEVGADTTDWHLVCAGDLHPDQAASAVRQALGDELPDQVADRLTETLRLHWPHQVETIWTEINELDDADLEDRLDGGP